MKKFKKALAILLMLSTMASFTGCISKEQPEASDATQVTYQIGSPGKAEDFEFGVTGINSFDLTTEYGETFHCLLVSFGKRDLYESIRERTGYNQEKYRILSR